MFVHMNGRIVNSNNIIRVDFANLVELNYIDVFITYDVTSFTERVHGAEAYNIVMELCPAALEGKRAQYHKNAWAIHNLIGHPLMQVLSWLNLSKLGIKVHDATVPDPITK